MVIWTSARLLKLFTITSNVNSLLKARVEMKKKSRQFQGKHQIPFSLPTQRKALAM